MPVIESDGTVEVSHPDFPNTSVRIAFQGATILSWTVKGQEKLWLSEKAIFDDLHAIRGGIPLVFPVFGKQLYGAYDRLPQHGFARQTTWQFLGQTTNNPPSVQFALGPDNLHASVREIFKHDFNLIYTITLDEKTLKTSMSIENRGIDSLDCNILFHNYLQIPDIADTTVEGLKGLELADKVLNKTYFEQPDEISIKTETDRVYENVVKDTVVKYKGKPYITVHRHELQDVVIWNPWASASEKMKDFSPPDGYKNMLCVEPGTVHYFMKIPPHSSFQGSQTLEAHDFLI